jgi:hypothetical protein
MRRFLTLLSVCLLAGCSARTLAIGGDPNRDGGTLGGPDEGVSENDAAIMGDLMPLFVSLVANWGNGVYDENGSVTHIYISSMDPATTYNGAPTRELNSTHNADASDCGIISAQQVDLSQWAGKRMRMTGNVKTAIGLTTGSVGAMWMAVYGPGGAYAGDDMSNRYLVGTNDFKAYSDVLDIPDGATDVSFGLYLCGTGQMWVSDIAFEPVGSSVPTTQTYSGTAGDGGV